MYAKYRITPPYAELSFHGSTTTSSSAGEHKVWHGSTAPAGPVPAVGWGIGALPGRVYRRGGGGSFFTIRHPNEGGAAERARPPPHTNPAGARAGGPRGREQERGGARPRAAPRARARA